MKKRVRAVNLAPTGLQDARRQSCTVARSLVTHALGDDSLVRRPAECSIGNVTESTNDDHDDDLGEPDGHCVQVH